MISIFIEKRSYKNIVICNIRYITIKNIDDDENINSVNTLYLFIGKADRYIEEINAKQYLVFTSTDSNKKVLIKFTKFWDEIKNFIETINKDIKGECEKDFNSDDNLLLNKMLNLHMLTVIVRSVFQEDGKYYPPVF